MPVAIKNERNIKQEKRRLHIFIPASVWLLWKLSFENSHRRTVQEIFTKLWPTSLTTLYTWDKGNVMSSIVKYGRLGWLLCALSSCLLY